MSTDSKDPQIRPTLERAPAPPPVEDAAVEEALRRMEDWLPIEADVDFATLRAALASLRSQVAAKDAEIERGELGL